MQHGPNQQETPTCPPPVFRTFTGRFSPRLIWFLYFVAWGVLVVSENVAKKAFK